MTRNTKTYISKVKINNKIHEVILRDLTILERSFLFNIKNEAVRAIKAAELIIENIDINIIPDNVKDNLGQLILNRSLEIIADSDLFELTVKEFREKVKTDTSMVLVSKILQTFPGVSILELLKMTDSDLIEIICVGEVAFGETLLNVGTKKGMKLVNPNDIKNDDGTTLAQKMRQEEIKRNI